MCDLSHDIGQQLLALINRRQFLGHLRFRRGYTECANDLCTKQ